MYRNQEIKLLPWSGVRAIVLNDACYLTSKTIISDTEEKLLATMFRTYSFHGALSQLMHEMHMTLLLLLPVVYFFRPCASPGLNGRSILNLRTTGLDEQTCAVLGKLLSVDRLFEHIDLADCALSDAGKL